MLIVSEEEKGNQTKKSDANSVNTLGIVFCAIYLVVLSIVCLRFSVIPGPEFFVALFLIYAANAKWTRVFVKDWIPFFVLFLSFEAMREVPYNTFGVVHVNQLGSVEVQLFRTLPTLLLQEFYRSPFLDYLGAFFLLTPLYYSYGVCIRAVEVFSKKLREICLRPPSVLLQRPHNSSVVSYCTAMVRVSHATSAGAHSTTNTAFYTSAFPS